MSIVEDFTTAAAVSPTKKERPKRKRQAPFSIRFSDEERAWLEAEAGGAPLGSFIKRRALAGFGSKGLRQNGPSFEDRTTLAKILARLGQSQIGVSLGELAHAASIGALPVTPETEAELVAATSDVRGMRAALVKALGLKPGDDP